MMSVGLIGMVPGCRSGEGDIGSGVGDRIRFVDATREAGLERRTPTYDAAAGDFDGDGAVDFYVGNHAEPAVLLRNDGRGRFTDALAGSGIDPQGDQHGTGFADFDNDGLLDLFVSIGAGRGLVTKMNRLYRGLGGGRFENVTEAAGVLDPRGRSRSVAWLDFDRDGYLDLLLANHATPNRLFRNLGDGRFEDLSAEVGLESTTATRVAWGDLDGDGWPDLLLNGGTKNLQVLRNESGRQLRDVTAEAGLASPGGWVQGMALGDFDGDGEIDLALSFGTDFTEGAIERDGEVRFVFPARAEPVGLDFEAVGGEQGAIALSLYENGSPVAPERIRCGATTPSAATFSCSAADAAVDAAPLLELGFAVWRESGTAAWHLRWFGEGDHHLSGTIQGARDTRGVGLEEEIRMGAALWRGVGGGRFEQAEVLPGEVARVNGQAVQWADVDNDGWLDLYLVDSGRDGLGGRGLLLRNDQGERFSAVPAESGATPDSGEGRGVGAHFADVDRDGRLDLFLTNGWGAPPFDRGPYRLLWNTSHSGHWLDVALTGRRSNRQGLGARIEVTACEHRQMRLVDGGGRYFSQSALPTHFGLGACERIDSVVVHWPSGTRQTVVGPPVDRLLQIVEEESLGADA